MIDRIPIKRALLSVSDKSGIVELAEALARHGAEILSTGGTARAIRAAGVAVRDVSELTGFPEMMDGRVKTLHPAIHGGLLARRDVADHVEAMETHGIGDIDLLAIDLYPFERTIASGADGGEAIEQIDIGGPAMIRSGAKNADFVTVVTDPADYAEVSGELAEGLPRDMRRRLAAKAFARTAAYDAAIASWYAGEVGDPMPERRVIAGSLVARPRYGENPHQEAGFYRTAEERPGVATAEIVQGKPLSYNNIADADAALELAAELEQEKPAVVIVKHANPCGVATAETLADAHALALRCDPISAFGGIVAVNRPLDRAAADAISALFTEVVIAPGADEDARAVFTGKPNLRLLITPGLPDPRAPGRLIRSVAGGFLVQDRDVGGVSPHEWKIPTKRRPSEAESADLLFAWKVAKHVKSNAIVYAKDGATVGIGAGQMSRLDSSRIAARKAEDAARAAGMAPSLAQGSVVASDAFFPFADGLLAAAEAGATAVVQPGGSMRDAEVIAAADDAGLAMVFTGMRHFRH